MTDLQKQKQLLRLQVKQEFKKYSPDELSAFSKEICQQVDALIEENKCTHVGMFAPLPDEPNIWPVFEKLKNEVNFYFPRMKNEEIEYVAIQDKHDLERGPWGILEPVKNKTATKSDQFDLVLVPGLAFTAEGDRLGRGKGFYDRLLFRMPKHLTTVGICFPFQMVQKIPTEPQDMKISSVIF